VASAGETKVRRAYTVTEDMVGVLRMVERMCEPWADQRLIWKDVWRTHHETRSTNESYGYHRLDAINKVCEDEPDV